MNQKAHWEQVYTTRPADQVGWFKTHLQTSLNWIKNLELPKDSPIIDIGGGASTLVDDLVDAGYQALTILDISEKALSLAKLRLGDKADQANWISGDITTIDLPEHHFDVWHDRAVFHFLTEPDHQLQYQKNLMHALKPGGHLIIGTFSPEAPPKCSGLPVQRYEPEQLVNFLSNDFELKKHHKELHVTPGGVEQMYLYCHFARNV